jgi:hypothetical protein
LILRFEERKEKTWEYFMVSLKTRTLGSTAMLGAVALAAIGGAVLVGCPGSLTDPERFAIDSGQVTADTGGGGGGDDSGSEDAGAEAAAPCDVVSMVFTPLCATSSCHSTAELAGANGHLDLQNIDYSKLINKPTDEDPTISFLNSSMPDQSAIYTALLSPPPGKLIVMPSLGSVTPTQVACVKNWVESVAVMPVDAGASSNEDGGGTSNDSGGGNEDASAPTDANTGGG